MLLIGGRLHPRRDRQGRPIAFALTSSERHEQGAVLEPMPQGAVRRPGRGRPCVRPAALLADKGHAGGPIRACLRRHRITAVIP
ncbi:MAG: hypothetical protein KDG89_13315 [Geminicoccaceae bacterium]|nr:hypothetical protein [Geminicoccaceae bacterium]